VKIQVLGTPPERYHHSLVVFEGSIYVFGGYEGYDDIHEYRFGTRTWSIVNTKGAPPSPRWGHCAVQVKRYMYVFGGCDRVINYNDLHRFHFGTFFSFSFTSISIVNSINFKDSGRWEQIPSGGYQQGYFQSIVVHSDRVYLFGGKNIHNYNFNDLWEYRCGTFYFLRTNSQIDFDF
jgi:hypothetical protein